MVTDLLRACPKPESRKKGNDRRIRKLKKYRREQYLLAIERDGGLCECGREGADVHHIYGRGREAGDWREHHDQLRCTCRECHPHGFRKD